ncbi:hypothetical protein N7517_008697 [Penicillium concentricum]|uniref:Uncharacterized protein n=1 Tax=Penicillium concentricum TaxID=293559 RepID=A0A9W9RT85_9EURO|nr:uncharacterized protein N7517_008697 [Penicillium concentricum]KAJ5365811.1 hypothetical protein N7517_008697 [Penicillium concentricum]
MAPQAFCCNKIRSPSFEDEGYRLGLFKYWAKAKDKRPPTKDDNLGLDVSFCVQLFQRANLNSTRLFVPTAWREFAEIDGKLLAAPWVSHGVESPILSPTSANPNIQVPDQGDHGDASSSTILNELTNIPGELDASTNPLAENDLTECPVGTDAKYKVENVVSLVNMPASQYVLDLIDRTRDTMRLNEVSLPTEADMLKIHMFHDLRELAESVDQNIFIWMLFSTANPIVKLLMSCSPSNASTKDDRDNILEATASAVNAMYCFTIGQREG